MTTGTGWGVFIQAGIGMVQRILWEADKVIAGVVIGFERGTKIKTNGMLVRVENIISNE